MAIFGGGGLLIFALLAARAGQAVFPPAARRPGIWVRTAIEMAGRLFYTLAVVLTPLSSVTAILQATPIVVVAGAALLFGERVGWRRSTAILVGLAGVLVILRPGSDAFTPLSVLAVLGMLGFAGRDLATRAAPPAFATFALGVWGFAAIVAAGSAFALWSGETWSPPDTRAAGLLALAVGIGTGAYAALTVAMRTGEVAAVTPFRYTRLLFGIALGVLVFGERPDAATLAGAALVVASGLYILVRGSPPGGASG